MKAWYVGAALALAIIAFTAARSQRAPGMPPHLASARPAEAAPVAEPRAQVRLERAPRLAVAFLLDPALTRSLYMGERWVSPPVFDFVQPGNAFTVRAKVQSIGRDGEATDLSGDWSTGNPGMLAITRGHGEVTLVVREAGEGDITVATGAGAKTLRVRATRTADAMQVAIAQ